MRTRVLGLAIAAAFIAGAARAECPALVPVPDTFVDAGGVAVGHLVDASAMVLLDIVRLVSDGQGRGQEVRFPDLPKGGIAGEHLCAIVEVGAITVGEVGQDEVAVPAGSVLARSTLILDGDADMMRLYPEAWTEASLRGQFHVLPARRAMVYHFDGPVPASNSEAIARVTAFHLSYSNTHGGQNCFDYFIRFDRFILMPVCS